MANRRTPTEAEFTAAVQTWRVASDQLAIARADASRRYRDLIYAPAKIRHAVDVLDRADRRAQDRVYAMLATISPREWTHGIPMHYVRMRLTYADAVTRGQLAQIPDPAYGYTQADSVQFAAPLPPAREQQRGYFTDDRPHASTSDTVCPDCGGHPIDEIPHEDFCPRQNR
jgi:hypothetical protein